MDPRRLAPAITSSRPPRPPLTPRMPRHRPPRNGTRAPPAVPRRTAPRLASSSQRLYASSCHHRSLGAVPRFARSHRRLVVPSPLRSSPPSRRLSSPAAGTAMGGPRALDLGVGTARTVVAVVGLLLAAAALLSSPAAARRPRTLHGGEVAALVAVRAALHDPGNVLADWVAKSGGSSPCRWSMVSCKHGHVYKLSLAHQNLSGTLSPAIGELRILQNLTLNHNAISGPIPDTIGTMQMLQILDLSNNQFTGSIPGALGDLAQIQDLILNNNSLTGPIPDTLAHNPYIFTLDLSFNNLSGRRPNFHAPDVILEGNPLLSDINCGGNESSVEYSLYEGSCTSAIITPPDLPIAMPTKRTGNSSRDKDETMYILCIVVVSLAILLSVIAAITGAILVVSHVRRREQVFAIADAQLGLEVHLGHLKQYKFQEIQKATNNFSRRNILGEGGYGIVYKGRFPDGTIVAVKRQKRSISEDGDNQFHIEVEVISLVVHRNLLHLIGFCNTNDERLLVYPYLPNGTVASKLQEYVDGKLALDWPRRKRIALGTAEGVFYLHEQCDPKIIHRDIKASNILLDEHLEAVVADFGLAKLLGHEESHVVTEVLGTIGRIPPESLMNGHSSEKSDVYGFGLLLFELVTGRVTLELRENEYKDGGILDWAKDVLEKDQLSTFVDKKLKNNYDSAELEGMVQIALLCTMPNPDYRPLMSEVIRMLEEGDGVAEKWEAMKNVKETAPGSPDLPVPVRHYSSDRRSSFDLEAVELSGPR
ncbi:hypothetical protein ACP4OV_006857 [Aristida adscensionis]